VGLPAEGSNIDIERGGALSQELCRPGACNRLHMRNSMSGSGLRLLQAGDTSGATYHRHTEYIIYHLTSNIFSGARPARDTT